MTVYAVDLGELERMPSVRDFGPGQRESPPPVRTFVVIPDDEVDELLAHFRPREETCP